jgi:hypothetical protein
MTQRAILQQVLSAAQLALTGSLAQSARVGEVEYKV